MSILTPRRRSSRLSAVNVDDKSQDVDDKVPLTKRTRRLSKSLEEAGLSTPTKLSQHVDTIIEEPSQAEKSPKTTTPKKDSGIKCWPETNLGDQKENESRAKTSNAGREKKQADREQVLQVRGRCKSGRFWKSERDRFRSIVKSKGLKQNFQQTLKLRKDRERVKEYEKSLKETVKREKEELRARQDENKKRRDENQRKNEVFQEVHTYIYVALH
jgi:hypothetical protein